jgi:transposase
MSKESKQKSDLQLAVIHPNSAAIDVGSMMMMVSYTDKEGNVCLLEVEAFTENLHALAETLLSAGVKRVAMEATGVYWMALFEILERYGLKVIIVNPRHFKNVDAQKTDVKDCQWLHQLHAHGLLRASHIAPELSRELRNYLHERNILQNQKSDVLNRIHKQLSKMNIKVQHLINDIEGVSGMHLLHGIAKGITNPEELLSQINTNRLKSDRADLIKSLKGDFKKQYISILGNLLKSYEFFKDQMKSYELLIEEVLQKMLPQDEHGNKPSIKAKKTYVRKNEYSINLKQYLNHIVGVDLTKVDGFDEKTLIVFIAVIGIDMSKWPSAEHFVSWLNLSARPKITGGKIIGYQKRFTNNPATQAFRMAAQSLWHNKGPLGQMYRRLAAKKGSKKAIKAVARKLAVIFYNMVKNKTEFDPSRLSFDSEKQKAIKLKYLTSEAAKYGFILQKQAG